MDHVFAIEDWLWRFPLWPDYGVYEGKIITSPCHLCNNHRLRAALADLVDWGPAVPMDVFVMADGEPAEPYTTKVGGLPYRPTGQPWPLAPDGTPWRFLAQFCFVHSHDLTGPLPGEVLLVFGDEDGVECAFEWQPLELTDLLQARDVPAGVRLGSACHGYRFRTVNYPEAKLKTPLPPEEELHCLGYPVRQYDVVFCYQATQIGRAPYLFPDGARLPCRTLCTLNSVQPDFHGRYPWVNRAKPLFRPGSRKGYGAPDIEKFMLGDMGCIYIGIDDHDQLCYTGDCY